MSANAWLPLAFILGYLLGSIPFGLILTRLAGTEDLRSIGSGNIGATNVLRTGRKGLAAATLLLDALKGTVAVIIAGYFAGSEAAMTNTSSGSNASLLVARSRPSFPFRSKAPSGACTNIAQPSVPMRNWIGTRAPCVPRW